MVGLNPNAIHTNKQFKMQQQITLPVPSTRLSSSLPLQWKGLVLEAHRAAAEPMEESNFPHLLVELAVGDSPAYGERATGRGEFKTYCKMPGMLNVYAEGSRPALRPTTYTNLIVAAFDKNFVSEVSSEMELHGRPGVLNQVGFTDVGTASLLSLLEVEAREGGTFGEGYSSHLIYGLAQRLLMLGLKTKATVLTRWSLPKPRLQRVIDRMRSDLGAPHALESLAEESGYSRNHFIRMFRAATGSTPHQYLLELRLKRAQVLLRESSLRLVDISAECGFHSQAQLSKLFQTMLGVSPSRYRRQMTVLSRKMIPFEK